jgi:hypothetical protein
VPARLAQVLALPNLPGDEGDIMTDPSQKHHRVVGWDFRAGDAVYRCIRYTPSGYDMRLIRGRDGFFPNRQPGYVTNVSEQAIGRTYHRVGGAETSPSAHEAPCVCWICRGDVAP